MTGVRSLDAGTCMSVDDVLGLSSREACDRALEAAAQSGHTFITVDRAGARAAAVASDKRRQTSSAWSAVDGVPVAIKDVIDTRGLRTTMASRHFADRVPTSDAAVVADLRKAGAVIVGKTNNHEFSFGILGNLGAFGFVRNPHDPSRLAGGSSSGSAAAVAQGIVPLAVGTDTAGSVRVPAALCGVVGFKPTLGTISSQGVFPLSPAFDTIGYFGTCVHDIGTVLAATGTLDARAADNSAADIAAAGLRSLRAQVVDPVAGIPYDLAVQRLAVREVDLPSPEAGQPGWTDLYGTVRSHEAYGIHRDLLSSAPELYQPATLERLLAGRSVSEPAVTTAKEWIARLRTRYLRAFTDADVLLCPSVPILAPRAQDASQTVERQLLSCSVIWNVLGWPALSIPHWVPDCPLPQSLQIVGKPGTDATVLQAGRLIERLLSCPGSTRSGSGRTADN